MINGAQHRTSPSTVLGAGNIQHPTANGGRAPSIDGNNFLRNAPEEMWRWMFYCEAKGWVTFPMELPVNRYTADHSLLLREAKLIVATGIMRGWIKPRVRPQIQTGNRFCVDKGPHTFNRLGWCDVCGREQQRRSPQRRIIL